MFNLNDFKNKLEEVMTWLSREYTQISTGRANPVLLDSVSIDSYGSKSPIKNVASITVEETRTLRIVPWDKSQIAEIQKAITDSGLPLSVSADDQGLRATIPQLTEENKKGIVKLLKEKLEESRVRVRGERNKAEKDIDTMDISDDEKRGSKESVQKEVDAMNKNLDEKFSAKQEAIMAV